MFHGFILQLAKTGVVVGLFFWDPFSRMNAHDLCWLILKYPTLFKGGLPGLAN
jgi:hypothetical protein